MEQQLELLWQYQQVDMEVERFEREMRQAPNRQKLLKQREFLMEQQNVVKRIEQEVAIMSDRMEAIRDEIIRLQNSVADLGAQTEKNPPETVEDARKQIQQAQKLVNTITRYESELTKLRKDADLRDRHQHEARVRAAKTRAEFDQLKKIYDVEYKKQSEELERLRARAAKAAKDIAPEMLERYKVIKKHSIPPMTRLQGDRCGGCNMSLPAAVLGQIRSGSAAVECENCGRIIITQ